MVLKIRKNSYGRWKPELYTVRFDDNGDDVVVVAKVKDAPGFEQSIAKELRLIKPVPESADLTDAKIG
jgi:hypothetical protein